MDAVTPVNPVNQTIDLRGNRHTDEIRELAFETWLFIADRNCAATARELDTLVEAWPPGTSCPDDRTIRRWARQEEWDVKAADRLAALAPGIQRQHAERLFLARNHAIEALVAVARDDFVDAKRAMARTTAARVILEQTGGVELPSPRPAVDDVPHTPADHARLQREMLERMREERRQRDRRR